MAPNERQIRNTTLGWEAWRGEFWQEHSLRKGRSRRSSGLRAALQSRGHSGMHMVSKEGRARLWHRALGQEKWKLVSVQMGAPCTIYFGGLEFATLLRTSSVLIMPTIVLHCRGFLFLSVFGLHLPSLGSGEINWVPRIEIGLLACKVSSLIAL